MRLTSGHITAREDGGIGWLIFDHEARLNAISDAMMADALTVIAAFEAAPSVQAVVMRGAGERAFISGGDISKFEDARGDAASEAAYRRRPEELQAAMVNLTKPLIAMIHGYCLGAGMTFAMAADLRFASRTARLGIPAARRGIVYPASSLKRLIDLAGPGVAKDLLFSARQMEADEALRVGLVDRLFAPDDLERETVAYANALAENAPLSVRAAKFFINQLALDRDRRDEKRMQDWIDRAAGSADFREATRAFAERRKPVFRGE